MRRSGIALPIASLSILLFLFPLPLFADQGDGPGAITGNLVNGTTGKPVPNLQVTLKRYEGDQEIDVQKTRSDRQGKFHFSQLDRSKGRTYFLYTAYKGVEYHSPDIEFKEQRQAITHNVTVYDTTPSDQKVSVVMHHVVLEPKGSELWVRELMVVENRDNKVFVGSKEIAPDKKQTLKISLPYKAQQIQLLRGLMSCCVVQLEDGFADTMDIKPGRKEIQFSYKVDYSTSKLTLLKRINLTTDSLNFFIPEQGIRAEGENLQYAGVLGETGSKFQHFAAKNLAGGSQVALHISGLPWLRRFLKGIAPILGVAILISGFLYPLIRGRKRSREGKIEPAPQSTKPATVQAQRESLLWAIAALDDQLDSGQISVEDHDKKRRALKAQVIQLTKTSGGKGG